MNRRTSATVLLVVVVLLAIVWLAPATPGAVKKITPTPRSTDQQPVVIVDEGGSPPVPAGGKLFPVPGPIPPEPAQPLVLHDAMRHLWMDHIVWSRNVSMSVFSDLDGREAYERRLAMNVYDVRGLLTPYFGKVASATFADLFMRHVTLASQVFDAYKSGNETAIRAVTYEWYQNADEISAFLCKINPAWDYEEMRSLWKIHLDTVVDEALDYQKADYEGDVMCYDAAQDHAFLLADFLSDGMTASPK